jgi:DNA-binding transcriptional LysR family regulator
LLVLITIGEAGSFSAAARRLGRTQSTVSHAAAALERELGLELWERTGRVPTFTDAGRLVLAEARQLLARADGFRELTEGLRAGLEPSLGIVVDAIFPGVAFVELARAFRAQFPTVELHVRVDTLASAGQWIRDRRCMLGVVGPYGAPAGWPRRALGDVLMVPVVARDHRLARSLAPLTDATIVDETQIVLSERDSTTPDQGVLSVRTWRIGDLHTKHALIRAGLGWGNMPYHLVADELARGELVRLRIAAWTDEAHRLPITLVTRPRARRGPATQWWSEKLAAACAQLSG